MAYIKPSEQLQQAEEIARSELEKVRHPSWESKEECAWYGVRETHLKNLPEEVLQSVADRVLGALRER